MLEIIIDPRMALPWDHNNASSTLVHQIQHNLESVPSVPVANLDPKQIKLANDALVAYPWRVEPKYLIIDGHTRRNSYLLTNIVMRAAIIENTEDFVYIRDNYMEPEDGWPDFLEHRDGLFEGAIGRLEIHDPFATFLQCYDEHRNEFGDPKY